MHARHPHRCRRSVARWVQMAALRAAICNALSGWVEAKRQYPSPMGLDDRRQGTGQDSGECPKTVTFFPRLRPSDLAGVFIFN